LIEDGKGMGRLGKPGAYQDFTPETGSLGWFRSLERRVSSLSNFHAQPVCRENPLYWNDLKETSRP
jgi:hypothetical protein